MSRLSVTLVIWGDRGRDATYVREIWRHTWERYGDTHERDTTTHKGMGGTEATCVGDIRLHTWERYGDISGRDTATHTGETHRRKRGDMFGRKTHWGKRGSRGGNTQMVRRMRER